MRFTVCLLLACVGSLAASEASISVRAEPAQVSLGSEVDVIITYRWPSTWQPATRIDPTPFFTGIEVQELGQPQTVISEGIATETWRLTIIPQRSGELALPRPQARFHTGSEMISVQAEEAFVQVGISGAQATLSPPRKMWERSEVPGSGTPTWVWWTPVALLVIGLLVVRVLLRRRGGPDIPPYQRLVDDLPAALACDDGKQAGAILSRALRRYCGDTWQFDGVASTARELLVHLDDNLPMDEHGKLQRIFHQLEDLRWAPNALTPLAVKPLIDAARDWAREQEHRLVQERHAAEQEAAA